MALHALKCAEKCYLCMDKPPHMTTIIADRQDITRVGLTALMTRMGHPDIALCDDKAALIVALERHADALVILDYNLFDLNSADELVILHDRFAASFWVIFSEDLSSEFIRRVMTTASRVSILPKDSPLGDIEECLRQALRHQRFVSPHVMETLLAPIEPQDDERNALTATEKAILRDIAQGLTTKEIAARRNSSFHTVNTHRKNIFRKLNVNNMHEAIKYAFRSGLVDSAEYYI